MIYFSSSLIYFSHAVLDTHKSYLLYSINMITFSGCHQDLTEGFITDASVSSRIDPCVTDVLNQTFRWIGA